MAGLIVEIALFGAIGASLIAFGLLPLAVTRLRCGVGSVLGSVGGDVAVSYPAILIPVLVRLIGEAAMLLPLSVVATIAFVLSR